MSRITIVLAGAALALSLPFTAHAQSISGSVGGAVSGTVDAATGGLGLGLGVESGTGVAVGNGGVSAESRTRAGLRAGIHDETETRDRHSRDRHARDGHRDRHAAQRRDATVTGSVTSGECNMERDICQD